VNITLLDIDLSNAEGDTVIDREFLRIDSIHVFSIMAIILLF